MQRLEIVGHRDAGEAVDGQLVQTRHQPASRQPHSAGHRDSESGSQNSRAASDDERPFGGECPPEPCQMAAPRDVEDQVIMLAAVGEAFPGVVDYLVGADRTDEIDLSPSV